MKHAVLFLLINMVPVLSYAGEIELNTIFERSEPTSPTNKSERDAKKQPTNLQDPPPSPKLEPSIPLSALQKQLDNLKDGFVSLHSEAQSSQSKSCILSYKEKEAKYKADLQKVEKQQESCCIQ